MGIVQLQHARLIESHKLQTVHHGTIMRYILEVYRRYERALMLASSHSPLCPLKVLQLAGRAALQRVMLLRSLQVAEKKNCTTVVWYKKKKEGKNTQKSQ